MKTKLLAAAFLTFTITGCNGTDESWIDVGALSGPLLKDGKGKDVLAIPYRYYDVKSQEGEVLKATVDTVDLALEIQAGRAIGEKVLISVYECFAPEVRKGVPSVQCHDMNGGTVYLGGNNEIRSKLLHLQKGQSASAVGKILGAIVNTPVIEVL